jgi:myo-inositol-1(or 4)-monophosphatase
VLEVAAKSTPTDPVSEADVEAEQLIRARLAEARPDDGIVGEEGDDVSGDRTWVVDPIDGTVNFLYGIPQWCVSIALEDEVGVIYDPMRDECWSVDRDGPPLLDGEPVGASGCDEMARALVATGFGYDAEVRAVQGAIAARLLPRVRDLRRAGSAALDLAWVACGRLDGYYEHGLNEWDWAGGALLVSEAGGVVRRLPAAGGLPVALVAGAADVVDALTAELEAS